MGLVKLAEPVAEPITVDEAKLHCRIPLADTDNDAWLAAAISAAREQAEARCSRTISPCQWELTLDGFPPQIKVPMPQVTSVVSVKYRDPSNNLLTLDSSNYSLDNKSYYTNWIGPAYGYSWPSTLLQMNSVSVVYEAGFVSGVIPAQIKLWVKLAIGAWFDVRAGMDIAPLPMQAFELPGGFFGALLEPWIVME